MPTPREERRAREDRLKPLTFGELSLEDALRGAMKVDPDEPERSLRRGDDEAPEGADERAD